MLGVKRIVFSWFCLHVVLSLIVAQANTAEATKCAPLSRFKIDCNTCYCSADGRRYTCSTRFCTSDVSLNFNDFMSDAPQSNERIYFDETNRDDWVKFLNDLASNQDQPEPKNENNEFQNDYEDNNIDLDNDLNDETEYIGSRRPGFRY